MGYRSKEELGDELCNWCPITNGEKFGTLCEGSYCDEAYENYIERSFDNSDNFIDALRKIPIFGYNNDKKILEQVNDKIFEELGKEQEKMKILEIYSRRKIDLIKKKYDEMSSSIIEKDDVRKLLIDTENQINVMLDKDEKDAVMIAERYSHLLKPETRKKLDKINLEYNKEIDELNILLEEVEARLEMTDNYEEQVKILKKYNIFNASHKLNLEEN